MREKGRPREKRTKRLDSLNEHMRQTRLNYTEINLRTLRALEVLLGIEVLRAVGTLLKDRKEAIKYL